MGRATKEHSLGYFKSNSPQDIIKTENKEHLQGLQNGRNPKKSPLIPC